MRNNFCIFILTHGRPDNVKTYDRLRESGYTGPIRLVVDDEDETVDQYVENYGDEVIQFSKEDVAEFTDEGDNMEERKSVVFARNAVPIIAEELGFRFFAEFDDDYNQFCHRLDDRLDPDFGGKTSSLKMENIDEVFDAMIDFLRESPLKTITMAQRGELFGGGQPRLQRKAMNTFIFDTENPVKFRGKLNDDVNTYVWNGFLGELFGTSRQISINQAITQRQEGGLTDIYEKLGTYVKSFMTVMLAPSCVEISVLEGNTGNSQKRIHHSINYRRAYPKILREKHKKGSKKVEPICRERDQLEELRESGFEWRQFDDE